MSFPPWPVACLMFIAAAIASGTTTQAASPVLQEAFGWLDAAGLPSVKGLQPVEVWTGRAIRGLHGSDKLVPMTWPAFLVSTKADSFQVLTAGGDAKTLKILDQPANPYRIGFKPRSFEWLVNRLLDGHRNNHVALWEGGPYPARVVLQVMLARQCRDLHEEDSLKRLEHEVAQQLQQPNAYNDSLSPHQRLAEDTAAFLLRRVLNTLETPSKSWTEIHQDLERVINILPNAPSSAKARLLADRIAKFIEEERVRPLLSHAQIIKLPLEQQAAEQVRRLRMHMELDTEDPTFHEGDNVVEQLVKLGTAAVPALIAAVDDHRPSRHLFHSFGSHGAADDRQLSSIGDLALNALRKISPKSLGHGFEHIYMPADAEPSQVKKEVEAWWTEYQAKGERGVLIDAILAEGFDSSQGHQAYLLIEKYPQDAGAVLIKAYAKLNTAEERRLVLRCMDTLHDPQILALLKQEVVKGETRACRTTAALSLRRLGDPSGTKAMLGEWDMLPPGSGIDSDGVRSLIEYLATSKDLDVVTHLVKDLRLRPLKIKLEIMQELQGASYTTASDLGQPNSRAIQALIEKTLIGMLGDDEERWNWGGTDIRDPSMGDHASWFLKGILPKEYDIDPTGSYGYREMARMRMARHWHLKTGTPWTSPEALPRLPDERRNEIISVSFLDSGLSGTEIEKSLLTMRGKPVNPDDLAASIRDFRRSLPDRISGIHVRLVRTPEPHGVRMTVWSFENKRPEKRQQINTYIYLALDRKEQPWDARGGDPWDDFKTALADALAKPADTELLVRLGFKAPDDE